MTQPHVHRYRGLPTLEARDSERYDRRTIANGYHYLGYDD